METPVGTPLQGFAAKGGGLYPTLPRIALIGSFVVLGTTIPVLTFILGLRMVGPSRAAIISTLEPAVTVMTAALVLGEHISLEQLLGGALILVSVLVLQYRAKPVPPLE